MSFRDLDIKRSYISYGNESIASSFLVPMLKQTKIYRRSVGFFSSSVFTPIIDGIVALSRNNGKIQLIAKKNVLIHTDRFEYEKRDTSFTKKQKIKSADYLVEYVENVGANLSLNINNYNDIIGKAKWNGDYDEIGSMTLEYADKNVFTGYTFNSDSFSLCNIGKQTEKQTNILL